MSTRFLLSTSFEDMFKGSTRYAIPIYQRGYSWEKEHVERFLADLEDAHQSDRAYTHFFGFMITTRSNLGRSIKEFVDGQQRMTTAMLFLLCVRNHFYRQNTHDFEQVNRYIEQLDRLVFSSIDTKIQKKSTPRLFLSDANRRFFHALVVDFQTPGTQLIKHESTSKTNQLLANAYRYLQNWLSKKPCKTMEDFQNIYEFVQTLLCKFTFYKQDYPDRKIAQKMFDLVNHRGRQLEESDLIKHYLFSELSENSDRQLVQFNKIWTKIINNVTSEAASSDLESFIHYYLIVSDGYSSLRVSPNQKRIYQTIEKLVPTVRSPQDAIRGLYDWSIIFLKLRDPTHCNEFDSYPIITQRLQKFKMLKLQHAYPAALAAYRVYWEQGHVDLFEKILAILLKYHIRVKLIMDKNVTNYGKTVSNVFTSNILHGSPLKKTLDDLITRGYYPSDTIVRYTLEDRRLKNSDAIKIILDELEPANTKPLNLVLCEVEHIMPEKPNQDWWDYIMQHNNIDPRDSTRAMDDAKNIHDKYLNFIGNQTLLETDDNKTISNKLFDEKLPKYATSQYQLTQTLKDFSVWNIAAINKRQAILADKLVAAIDLKKFFDEL